MALTDAEMLQMTAIALMRYSVVTETANDGSYIRGITISAVFSIELSGYICGLSSECSTPYEHTSPVGPIIQAPDTLLELSIRSAPVSFVFQQLEGNVLDIITSAGGITWPE